MGEKEVNHDLGFKIFVTFVEIVTLAFIFIGAWLLNKILIAPPLIISLRLVRLKIETKFDVFHLASVFSCIILSVLVSWFGLYLSLPQTISFISNIIVGVGFAIISWHIQDIINLKKSLNAKDNLIARCKERNYDELKTQIAVKFFIDKEKPKQVWLWLCETQKYPMEWDSVKTLKYRMKKDLF